MDTLTVKQARLLAFVKSFIKKNGYAPTRREISTHYGWSSTNAADQQLTAIARKGFVRLGKGGISRCIVPIK